jgi:hypothetical protein
MNTKLRLVTGLAAGLMFAAGLSACSDDEAETDTTTPAAETETSEPAETETSTS